MAQCAISAIGTLVTHPLHEAVRIRAGLDTIEVSDWQTVPIGLTFVIGHESTSVWAIDRLESFDTAPEFSTRPHVPKRDTLPVLWGRLPFRSGAPVQPERVPPNADIAVAKPSSASRANGIELRLEQDCSYYTRWLWWQSLSEMSTAFRSHPAPV